MDIISRDSAQTLAYDALFLACMHSPIPKSLTLLVFAGTTYQRGPEKAVVYTLDALAIYGLLSVVRSPLRWTNLLRLGGTVVWGGLRVRVATNPSLQALVGAGYVLGKRWLKTKLFPSHRKQHVSVKRIDNRDKLWNSLVTNVGKKVVTSTIALDDALKTEIGELLTVYRDQKTSKRKPTKEEGKLLVGVTACLVQAVAGSEPVTFGTTEQLKWLAKNSQVYCVLSRPQVLMRLLSGSWAVCGKITCGQGLLSDEQWEEVQSARMVLGLSAIVEL